MNHFEAFVASSEACRADMRRSLRLLRELDERVHFHTRALEAVAAAHLAAGADRPAAEEEREQRELFAFHKRMVERYCAERRAAAQELHSRGEYLAKIAARDLSRAYVAAKGCSQP